MPSSYVIPNGQTATENMGGAYMGGSVSFQFFGAGGAPVIPVGLPRVFRTGSAVEVPVYQFAANEWRFNGVTSFVRVDLAGVSGYTTYRVVVWRTEYEIAMIPDGAYSGLRALLTQGYNEANVKNGVQFYCRVSWPLADPIVAGTPRKIRFRTGAKPVIIKGRLFDFVSEEMVIDLYRNPTGVSGGAPVTVRNFNQINPVATSVTIDKNVVATGNGTLIDDPEYFFGSANAPQRAPGSIPQGRERVLAANSDYLVVTSGAGRAQYMIDWYEGGPDLPLTL